MPVPRYVDTVILKAKMASVLGSVMSGFITTASGSASSYEKREKGKKRLVRKTRKNVKNEKVKIPDVLVSVGKFC